MILSKRRKKIQSFLVVILLLMPIINQYLFFPLTCWEVFALTVTIYGLIDNKGSLRKPVDGNYFLFSAYILLFLMVTGPFYRDLGFSSLMLRFIKFAVVTVFVLMILPNYVVDINVVKKWYKTILTIVSLTLLLQLIMYYLMGKQFYPMLPNVTLNYNDGVNSSQYINSTISQIAGGYYFRPSSFFIEPAHFALFSLPGIILELFDPNFNKKNAFFSILFTICSLLTTSSIALIACAICWLSFVITRRDLWKSNFGWMTSIVFCVIPIALYFIASNSSIITTINIKLSGLSNMSQSSSISLRLTRGIQYYKNMGFIQQLIGVGYGNLTSYYYSSGMSIIGSGIIGQVSYMNGISTILCSFGIIGLLLFGIFLLRQYRYSDVIGKTLIFVFILVMLGSDMFDSVIYYIFIFLIFINRYQINGDMYERNN